MRKVSRANETYDLNYHTAALPCIGCGLSKGNEENGKCSATDGPECKARQREKTRGSTTEHLFLEASVHTAKEDEGGTFKPPAGVQSAARKALKWIEEGKAGDGFTSVGRGRAHQLASGKAVSLAVVKKMHAYFSRHIVDKKGKDWDKPSAGKVAWYAWGGDAGASWSKSIAEKHGDGKKKDKD